MRKLFAVIAFALLLAIRATAGEPLRVSILGDSYSTFAGYLAPDTNLVWYNATEADLKRTDVMRVEQTWWHQLLTRRGWTLERNNSYSGSTVCNTGYRGEDYTHESFVTRASNLGAPDAILVFGGTNDSWAGAPIGDYKFAQWTRDELYSFRPAMACLLDTLRTLYPKAAVTVISNDGLKPAITESMDSICRHYGVPMIQLRDISKRHGHPDQKGMRAIADQIDEAMR